MRRWDGLVDRYIEEYSARGIAGDTVINSRRELEMGHMDEASSASSAVGEDRTISSD